MKQYLTELLKRTKDIKKLLDKEFEVNVLCMFFLNPNIKNLSKSEQMKYWTEYIQSNLSFLTFYS